MAANRLMKKSSSLGRFGISSRCDSRLSRYPSASRMARTASSILTLLGSSSVIASDPPSPLAAETRVARNAIDFGGFVPRFLHPSDRQHCFVPVPSGGQSYAVICCCALCRGHLFVG